MKIPSARAGRAKSLHHVVDSHLLIPGRQVNLRNRCIAEAEGALATLTIEVDVHVIILLTVMAEAQLIAHHIIAILQLVYQMVLLEQRQRAEDIRFVNRLHPCLQLFH